MLSVAVVVVLVLVVRFDVGVVYCLALDCLVLLFRLLLVWFDFAVDLVFGLLAVTVLAVLGRCLILVVVAYL